MEQAKSEAGPRHGGSLLLAMAALVFWGVFAFVLLFIAPRYAQVFSDFGVALPAMTAGLLRLMHWMQGSVGPVPAGVVASVGLVGVLGVGAWMASSRAMRMPGVLLLAVMILGSAGATAGAVMALAVPMIDMSKSIQVQATGTPSR